MKPYYERGGIVLYHAHCCDIIPSIEADCVVTDPPYGETNLEWDTIVDAWVGLLHSPQLWCFGSLRFFFQTYRSFIDSGWNFAQEVVWEKHNGSGFHTDRFRRVHEFALHFYRGAWSELRLMASAPDLLDGLRTYGEHKPACAWMARYGNPESPTTIRKACDCGLEALLSRASGGADRG